MKNFGFKYMAMALLAGCVCITAVACSDDDDDKGGPDRVKPAEVKFIITADDVEKDLRGGAYMQVMTSLDNASRRDVNIYGETTATYSPDGFAQVSYNYQTNTFSGHIYAKGAGSAEAGGIGESGKRINGMRTYRFDGTKLTHVAPFKYNCYGNVGVFGAYSYSTSRDVAAVVDKNGSGKQIEVDFSKFLIDGASPSITNIVGLGNGQVAMALYYADRDSFAVGFADEKLNVSKVIFSLKAGQSFAGRKAARYSHLVADDKGNLYAFGGTAKHAEKIGAVRINKGSQDFDANYWFDINAKVPDTRIRKVMHISDDKFLLEFFEDKGHIANMGNTGKFMVADMSDRTLTEVTGLPEKVNGAYIGKGDSYRGKYYLPVSSGTGLVPNKAIGITPTIYVINGSTGKAETFMTFKANHVIKGFTIVTK